MSWRRRFGHIAVVAAVAFSTALQVEAMEPKRSLDAKRSSFETYRDYDILAVEVLAVDREVGTAAEPPKVTLEIEEVVRGRVSGPTVVADWAPSLVLLSFFGRDPQAKLVRAPTVGDRLIVFAKDRSGTYTVEADEVYIFSEANLATARRLPLFRPGWGVFIAIFMVVPGIVLLSITPFVLSCLPVLSARTRRWNALAVLAASLLIGLLYLFYETYLPPSRGRHDLFVLVPALILALILALISLARLRWLRKDS